jgi:hypothetical protein
MASKDWVDGIPWAIAVVGWAVTHVFSESRERRKESRAQMDKLYENLGTAVAEAYRFHTAAEFDTQKARELVAKVHRVERLLNRIGCFDQDAFVPGIIQLRRSITLNNFDKSEFEQQQADSEILEGIESASEEIEDEMERQYRFEYPSRFPFMRFRSGRKGPKVWSK